ncbi:MAG TPA: hypothetical protein DCQ98_22350 [Planctomycetaceae bacterium]|nr:hypothetical protein [Planctomycetaceae bacterium]HRF00265.1 hypothetical protein [Pirellulaceae bacterium]
MAEKTIRVVTRATDGTLKIKDYQSFARLEKLHEQIGVDDSSTDLSLRGFPLFRGLIGPIPEGRGIARYESPEVFEQLTKEWAAAPGKKRRRRRAANVETDAAALS